MTSPPAPLRIGEWRKGNKIYVSEALSLLGEGARSAGEVIKGYNNYKETTDYEHS